MGQKIGIIGGSGLYNMDDLMDVNSVRVDTPWGPASDEYVTGNLGGVDVVFLARHGKGHRLTPSEINYRANIYGMKFLGVSRILSISAVGSLKKEYKPRDMVVPDQFVDRTNQGRKGTFFGEGCVAHISFGQPICPVLAEQAVVAGRREHLRVHAKGTYVNMEGPAFSTKAESQLYRSWGMDVIGMTNLYEAKLAREAEICYVTMAMVTDYDCWHEEEEDVTVETVVQHLLANVDKAKKMIRRIVPEIPVERNCFCAHALDKAIITEASAIPDATKKKLELIIGKQLKDRKS